MRKPYEKPTVRDATPEEIELTRGGTLELDEGERQMVLMALAHLSVERRGWDDALNRLALRIDCQRDGRAAMYDEFRQLHRRAQLDAKASGEPT